MPELRTLLAGLGIAESARWHDGRLWFCHWGKHEVVAVDLGGHIQVIARVPKNAGYSIDWLPDGRLLVTRCSGGKHGQRRGFFVPFAFFSVFRDPGASR